jgi:hypothetical protein
MRSPSSGDAGGHLNSMQERTDAVERSGSPYFQGLNTASLSIHNWAYVMRRAAPPDTPRSLELRPGEFDPAARAITFQLLTWSRLGERVYLQGSAIR